MVFPVDMSLHKKSKRFDIAFDDGQSFSFSFEFLRVFSPSAEVTGHTPDQAKLQVGKRDVDVKGVEPTGRYAVRFIFDDGHDSGIYSWEYLHDIGTRQQELWDGYLAQLKEAGASRDPADPANVPFMPKPNGSCVAAISCNHPIACLCIAGSQSRSNSAGCTGNHNSFLFHSMKLPFFFCMILFDGILL